MITRLLPIILFLISPIVRHRQCLFFPISGKNRAWNEDRTTNPKAAKIPPAVQQISLRPRRGPSIRPKWTSSTNWWKTLRYGNCWKVQQLIPTITLIVIFWLQGSCHGESVRLEIRWTKYYRAINWFFRVMPARYWSFNLLDAPLVSPQFFVFFSFSLSLFSFHLSYFLFPFLPVSPWRNGKQIFKKKKKNEKYLLLYIHPLLLCADFDEGKANIFLFLICSVGLWTFLLTRSRLVQTRSLLLPCVFHSLQRRARLCPVHQLHGWVSRFWEFVLNCEGVCKIKVETKKGILIRSKAIQQRTLNFCKKKMLP